MRYRDLGDRSWLQSLQDSDTRIVWRHFNFSTVPNVFSFASRVIDEHVLWYVVDGSCRLQLPGESGTLEAGSVLWVGPNTQQSAHVPANAKPMTVYSFRFRVRRQR